MVDVLLLRVLDVMKSLLEVRSQIALLHQLLPQLVYLVHVVVIDGLLHPRWGKLLQTGYQVS